MSGPVLRDIHLPPEPGWWPPAPGWWLLAGLAAILLALLMAACLRRWRRRRRRRAIGLAVREAMAATDPATRVTALSSLLRRAARRHAPAMATAHGEAWLSLLDGDSPERPFSRGPGRLLLEAPYRRSGATDAEVESLAALVEARLLALVEERSA